MKAVKSFLCATMILFFISIGLTLAQDAGGAEAVNQELKDSDVEWAWGEVVSTDIKGNVINIKHLDYEDNQEKEMPVVVNSDTTYENSKSLEEIKPQDFLSIDYVITKDGKNVAKNIGLDKPKGSQVVGEKSSTAGQEQVAGQTEAVGQAQTEEKTEAVTQAQVAGDKAEVVEGAQTEAKKPASESSQ